MQLLDAAVEGAEEEDVSVSVVRRVEKMAGLPSLRRPPGERGSVGSAYMQIQARNFAYGSAELCFRDLRRVGLCQLEALESIIQSQLSVVHLL